MGNVHMPIMLVENKRNLRRERLISYEGWTTALAGSWNGGFCYLLLEKIRLLLTFTEGYFWRQEKLMGQCHKESLPDL